jgi:limonene-1,2-epoxide hydrolase
MNMTKQLTRRAFSVGSLAGLATLWMPPLSGQETPKPSRFASASEEKANIMIVKDFCASWDLKDLDKIASLLSEDCSFRFNQSRPAIVGKEKVVELFKSLFAASSFQLKLIKTAALGPVVLTEREDIITPLNGTAARRIKIAGGMFFVNDGKIAEWTDYQIK